MNVKILPGCLLYSLMIFKIAFQWNWKQAIFEKKSHEISQNFNLYKYCNISRRPWHLKSLIWLTMVWINARFNKPLIQIYWNILQSIYSLIVPTYNLFCFLLCHQHCSVLILLLYFIKLHYMIFLMPIFVCMFSS